ncbi:MAG: hypothetical protein K0S67_2169 [Nitrososphaeraceae archaeon]|nr:hypothetical protein [Nitrososphaeraceae archaeon]
MDVIQIDDLDKPDNDGIHKTGAIYNFAAPSKIVSQPVESLLLIDNWSDIYGVAKYDAKSKVSFRNILE